MKIPALVSLLFCVFIANAQPDLLPGNFWPNPAFEEGENLDATSGTPTGWQRGGNSTEFCQVIKAGQSTNHALAVVDIDNRYAEWYSDLSLAGRVSTGDKLDLQWFELYEIAGSEMRVTILFLSSSGGVVDVKHFVTRGTSEGFTGDLATSTFTKRNETIDVPEGAATLRFSLVSGGTVETTGMLAIDDLSVARHPAPILLPANLWTNSPTFETGTDLDQPTGTPENWRRGGADATILQVTSLASISPTHALAVVDTNNSYGEWYSDLSISNLVRQGDTLNLQWFELYNIAGGEMRVTVLLLSSTGAVVEAQHYVTRGQSSGWTGSIDGSSFTKRNESIVVPEGTATMRVSLVSGGPGETTGVMVMDDFSMNMAAPPLPEVLAGNVWPNPGFEEGENLEDPANATVANWQRGGNDPAIDLLSSENSVSRTHALAVVDDNVEGYGEWYADFQLGAATAPGKTLDLQWFELFNVQDGEMRLTLVFFGATNQIVGESHFVAQGSSSGWKGTVASSTFSRRNEKVAVPTGATRLRASLVSGGPAATRGAMLIDNLSVAPEPNQPAALFGNFWNNPGFEEGTELENPKLGLPTGWIRGGADISIDQVITDAFMSSTHALALIDTKTDSFGEWYQFLDLAGRAAPGDALQVQWWEMFSITNGEMRVSIHFLNAAGATVESQHFVARNQSSGWSEDIARSFFTKRNEQFTVPANATRMLVTLTSGGPMETTGVMVIDDLSFAKPPPPPDILAGNVWPNPTFEKGTQLDKPTLGAPDGGWRRGGNNIPGDQVTTLRATSPTHALAVIDTKEDAYSEWYVQVPISGLFAPGDLVDVQWYQLYDTDSSMRVSFYFRAQDQAVISQQHFQVSGQSPDWTGDIATSPFEKRTEQVEVPDGAVFVLITLTSGGPLTATGTFIIDDFSLRPVKNEFQIAGLTKAANGWQLSWQSTPGKNYAVQSAAALGAGGFQDVPGLESVAASEGAATSAVDTRANLGPAQFYRVVELP